MPMTINLETARGGVVETVADQTNGLSALLPEPTATDFPYLRFVDRYGDTVFNRLQMEPFVQEWTRLSSKAGTASQRELLVRVEALAKRCGSEPHLYLRFVGD